MKLLHRHRIRTHRKPMKKDFEDVHTDQHLLELHCNSLSIRHTIKLLNKTYKRAKKALRGREDLGTDMSLSYRTGLQYVRDPCFFKIDSDSVRNFLLAYLKTMLPRPHSRSSSKKKNTNMKTCFPLSTVLSVLGCHKSTPQDGVDRTDETRSVPAQVGKQSLEEKSNQPGFEHFPGDVKHSKFWRRSEPEPLRTTANDRWVPAAT